MKKFELTKEHKEKRADKKKFVLRYDIFGSYMDREMSTKDYFDFHFAYPDEVDKIILDAMFCGDFYSVYDSKILPPRRFPMFARFRSEGVDVFGEFVKEAHSRGKEIWLSHRISEVPFDVEVNPYTAHDDHPDWFCPGFPGFPGYDKMVNLASAGMREHKRMVLAEVMRKYDFDGLDIDFERHTPCLPAGRQWELRGEVTEFMRMLRQETLKIAEETGRVVMLSARVPDCLDGCHIDGLDIETWIKEDLVDALTMGSRSFDVKLEDIRALSDEIQLYGGYDTHHAVDGYALPTVDIIRGVWYSYLARGGDAVEYFNWCGEGRADLVKKYIEEYGMSYIRDGFAIHAHEDFTGINDKEFLKKQDKTYVIDRKGGYPWGVGYGNLNADRQLPVTVEEEGGVKLYVGEDAADYKKATLNVLIEETDRLPELYFCGKKLEYTSEPKRDLQVTKEKEAPVSGFGVSQRLLKGIDMSKPCLLLSADVTGMHTEIGYQDVTVKTDSPVSLEKVELALLNS